MASLNTTIQNALAARAVQNFDRLEILEGATVIATFDITWGAGSDGVQEVQSTPVETTASDGTSTGVDGARLYDSGASGEELTGLTVTGTGGGGDVEIDNTSVSNGQTVNLTALSITMPSAV